MYKPLSLKIKNDLFKETEELIREFDISRNRYINDALSFYNIWMRRQMLRKKLLSESELVAKNSLEMLKVMEKLEDSQQ